MINWRANSPKFYLPIVIGLYLFLGIIYVLVTPPLEASDEYKHYPVVQHLQNTGTLPILDPAVRQLWQQEAAQPPLYYIIMAAVTYPIDTSDLVDRHKENSFAFIGDPNQIHNKNLILHEKTDYAFPNSGSLRAVYVIRLVTLVLGVGTISVAWKIGKLLRDEQTALLAAILTAFQPMFIFTNAAVNNDSLANLLGASGLYLLIRLHRTLRADAQHIDALFESDAAPIEAIEKVRAKNIRRFVQYGLPLAVILGLGILTKLSILGLLLLTGIVMMWHARRDWRILFVDGLAIFVIAMAIASPMFVRNIQLYGWTDPTAVGVFVEVQGTRSDPLTWRGFVGEFGTFYRNYWGQFGGINIPMPEWLYNAYNLLFIVGIVGFLRARVDWRAGWWIIFGWVGIIVALLLRWTFIYYSFQGRLVFPALAGINVVLATGLLAWLPLIRKVLGRRVSGFANPETSLSNRLLFTVHCLLFTATLALALFVIRPVYAWPEPLATVPVEAAIDPIRYVAPDGVIELVGVGFDRNQSVLSGGGSDPIDITLYWQAPQPPGENYLSAINILGRELTVVGRVNRHPAWGMIPVSKWQPDQVWRDDYKVWIDDDATPLAKLQLVVDMYDPDASQSLPATTSDGTPITLVTVGEARLGAHKQIDPDPAVTLNAEFADGITLVGYDISAELPLAPTLPLSLTWRATASPAQDYTVFVQLLDANDQLVGSGDAEPVNNGDYPTSLWKAGDIVVDNHVIVVDESVEAGSYRIAVGLYNRDTGVRVPLVDGGDAVVWEVNIVP